MNDNLKMIIFALIAFFFVVLFAFCIDVSDKSDKNISKIPHIGQKLWMYNINQRIWYDYKKSDYELNKNGYIVLQLQQDQQLPDVTSYNILSTNSQISYSPLFLSEGSSEFIINKKLFTFYPRYFEISEVLFNGYNFVLNKLDADKISKIFNGYSIIRLSDFKNHNLKLKFSKRSNKYIIINDLGANFYMYYIVPNDNKKMQIGELSNQFVVYDEVDIRLQRLEGCTKIYPCYEINIVK